MPTSSTSGFPPRRSRVKRVFVAGLLLLAVACFAGVAIYLKNSRMPDFTVPTPNMPADNGYDDFVRAGILAGQMTHPGPYNLARTTAQPFTYANYQSCAPDAVPVQRAVQAGLKKACLCPPLRASSMARVSEITLFPATARALAGKAGYEAICGQSEKAANTLLDLLEANAMLPRGGGLLTGIIAISCDEIATRPLEALIPKLSDVELANMAKRLDVIAAKRAPYADIVAEEGNIHMALTLEFLRQPDRRGLPLSIREVAEYTGSARSWRARMTAMQLMVISKEAIVRNQQNYLKALTAEAKQPYAGPSRVTTGDNPLLSNLVRTFATSRAYFVSMEAVANIIRVEVALERYKRAQNHYPSELARLTPAYLQAVPLDPCINAPLRYQTAPNGRDYVLYSVGADQKDDHAVPPQALDNGSPGDLVAHHFWKPLPLVSMPGKQTTATKP